MDGKPSSDPQATEPGRRRSSRVRLYLPATVETTFDRGRAAIYNLSSTGAQVSLDVEPRMGSDVLLKCGAIEALCTIVWTDGNVCGLEFDQPLSEAQVLSTRSYAEQNPQRQRTERLSAAKDWSEGR